MFGQAATGALSLILAVLTATGVIRVWHIYSITLISSSLTAIYTPARTAIIPSLVPRDLMLNAFALTSTVWKVAHLAGPALAGGIIVFLGVSATYLINGAAHVVTLFALAAMQLRALPEERHPTALRSLMETISFIRRESIIVVLMAMDFGAVYFGTYRVLLPVFARNLGVGADGLGLLLSASGIGALVGAAGIMMLGNVRYKGLLVAGGVVAYSAILVVLATSPWFLLSLLAVAGLGFFDSVQTIPRNAVIQSLTPDGLRGRVASVKRMLTMGAPALGEAQAGMIATMIGAPLTLIFGAIISTSIIGTILGLRKDLRDANL
jgi:predicted MFS family arabinose efflux permease